jgi:hypothetical protein
MKDAIIMSLDGLNLIKIRSLYWYSTFKPSKGNYTHRLIHDDLIGPWKSHTARRQSPHDDLIGP